MVDPSRLPIELLVHTHPRNPQLLVVTLTDAHREAGRRGKSKAQQIIAFSCSLAHLSPPLLCSAPNPLAKPFFPPSPPPVAHSHRPSTATCQAAAYPGNTRQGRRAETSSTSWPGSAQTMGVLRASPLRSAAWRPLPRVRSGYLVHVGFLIEGCSRDHYRPSSVRARASPII